MIPRYTREEMGKIWSEESKFAKWLDVEVAVLEAKECLHLIPLGIAQSVKESVAIYIQRISELEKTTDHDVMAFIQSISEQLLKKGLKVEAQYFHAGMTSYDIVDTALAISLRDSISLLISSLEELLGVLGPFVLCHAQTLQIGRTHGIHAEPITLGFKLANWYDELERHHKRIEDLKAKIAVGKISGAVGIYANIDPRIEQIACEILGLAPARISTQIISRDRHAEYVFTLALIAGSLGKFATEIRNLHRTEIAEVSEPFKKGQKGSSAMPHKKNPISSENITSLSRLMHGYVLTAMENQETWHERDLANSANERVILADSSIILDYMLSRFTRLMRNIIVRPEQMQKNLWLTQGAVFSEQVMLALAQKGLPREKAHDLVQELALVAIENQTSFVDKVLSDERVMEFLTEGEVLDCFDPAKQLKNLDVVFKRFNFLKWAIDKKI